MKILNKIIISFLSFALLFIFTFSSPQKAEASGGKDMIGYFTQWGVYGRAFNVSEIQADKFTHIVYAFIKPTISGGVAMCTTTDAYADFERYDPAHPGDINWQGNIKSLQTVRSLNPGLKIVMSIAGATLSTELATIAASSTFRGQLVNSCVQFMRDNNFDGIDMDWEFPTSIGQGNDYATLMSDLRTALNTAQTNDSRTYSLSMAVINASSTAATIPVSAFASNIDWFGLMAYDYYGAFGPPYTTNFNAPLYADPANPSVNKDDFTIDAGAQNYMALGIPANKIVMGIPYYGRSFAGVPNINNGLYQNGTGPGPGTFEAGVSEYGDLKTNYVNLNGFTRYYSTTTAQAWVFNPTTNIWIGYDDNQTIAQKIQYVKDNNFKGVMMWDLATEDLDGVTATHDLTNAITYYLTATSTSTSTPTVTFLSPANGATVSGNVGITATTSGGIFPATITLLDGTATLTTATDTLNFVWNTASTTNGVHTLNLNAVFANGSTTSSSRTVTINNSIPSQSSFSFTIPIKYSTGAILENNYVVINDPTGVNSASVKLRQSGGGNASSTCIQISSTSVGCYFDVSKSGNVIVQSINNSGASKIGNVKGFSILATPAAPSSTIAITAPTKISSSPITDTTISITAASGILAGKVKATHSQKNGYNSFVCTQSSATVVNCTISVLKSGNLIIQALAENGAANIKVEKNYKIQ